MQRLAGWGVIAVGLAVIALCLLDLVGSSPLALLSRDAIRWPLEAGALYAVYLGVGIVSSERD